LLCPYNREVEIAKVGSAAEGERPLMLVPPLLTERSKGCADEVGEVPREKKTIKPGGKERVKMLTPSQYE